MAQDERGALWTAIVMRLSGGVELEQLATVLNKTGTVRVFTRTNVRQLLLEVACLHQYRDVRADVAARWTGGDLMAAVMLLGEAAVDGANASRVARGESVLF